MRIRILKTVYYDGKNHYHTGDVVDVSESQAKQWLRMNVAMQDKSIEPTETKINTEKSVIHKVSYTLGGKNGRKQI